MNSKLGIFKDLYEYRDTTTREENGPIEQYLNWEIDEYELADKLALKYAEIGAFIMMNVPRRRVPEECQTAITVDYGVI
jgi:hypothetical protein